MFENVNGRTHGRTHRQMHDGRKVITIAHPEQSSGELKKWLKIAPYRELWSYYKKYSGKKNGQKEY